MKTIQAKMHNSISWAIFTALAALFLFQGKSLLLICLQPTQELYSVLWVIRRLSESALLYGLQVEERAFARVPAAWLGRSPPSQAVRVLIRFWLLGERAGDVCT